MEYQFGLFDTDGNAHQPKRATLVDDRLPAEAKPRLTRQAVAVLARLEQGPATNMELIPIATRFSARIYDLRKAGYIIETDMLDSSNGITLYTLKGQR